MKPFSLRMPRLGTENAFSVISKAKKFEKEANVKLVYLQIGEPGFDTPKNINEAAIKAINANKTHYTPTPGIPELREAVAKYHSKYSCTPYDASNVVVVAGGKPIIFYTINALIDEGDEVIVPNPGYPIYESVTSYLGGKIVPIALKEENDFNFSAQELEGLITPRTKLIILNSPQNPTGAIYSKELISAIAEIAKKHDLWILADEIYDQIVHEGEHISITSIEGMPERTIVLNGCSKTFAMTGYRVGWGVTKNVQMAAYLEQFACNDISCTNTIAQYAALEAVTGPQEEVKKMVEMYKARRDLMVSLINQVPGMSCKSPKGAFYIMANVKQICAKLKITAAELCDRIMREAHVLILPATVFGEFAEGYVRFSYVSTEDQIKDGLAKIKSFIEKIY